MTKKKEVMAIPAAAARRLRAAVVKMEAVPARADMCIWTKTGVKATDLVESIDYTVGELRGEKYTPPCGTVGCIAGWVASTPAGMKLQKKLRRSFGLMATEEAAKRLLRLEHTSILFYPDSWPDRFFDRIESLRPGTKKYVKVIRDRVEYFIKTGR